MSKAAAHFHAPHMREAMLEAIPPGRGLIFQNKPTSRLHLLVEAGDTWPQVLSTPWQWDEEIALQKKQYRILTRCWLR